MSEDDIAQYVEEVVQSIIDNVPTEHRPAVVYAVAHRFGYTAGGTELNHGPGTLHEQADALGIALP